MFLCRFHNNLQHTTLKLRVFLWLLCLRSCGGSVLDARICRRLARSTDAPNQTPLHALQLHLTLQVAGMCSHHSLSRPLQRAKRSVAHILALAKATCSSGLQKNSHFLSGTRWGAPSFLCSLVLPRCLLSDLSSRGLVKITWQGRVKGPDEPSVPGVLQTSAELSVFLKWRGHWKEGAASRRGVSHYWLCRKVARWVNRFVAHSKLLQPLGIKFNLHNMLELLWCFLFFESVPGCDCCFTVDFYTVWIIVFASCYLASERCRTRRESQRVDWGF